VLCADSKATDNCSMECCYAAEVSVQNKYCKYLEGLWVWFLAVYRYFTINFFFCNSVNFVLSDSIFKPSQ